MTTNDTSQASLKSIFVISPIGKLDHDGFDFTSLFLHEIVKPAAEAAGGFHVPIRADEVRAPGSITAKVMRDIVNADVCVADLTGRNPNVMYEVAIAHAADKPVILLQQEAGGPPFDFTDERVIHYSTRADEANRAKRALTDHLKNAHHEDADEHLQQTMHPVRIIFRDLQTRVNATEPEQAILERLDSVTRAVKILEGAALERAPMSSADGNDNPRSDGSQRPIPNPSDRISSARSHLIEPIHLPEDHPKRMFCSNAQLGDVVCVFSEDSSIGDVATYVLRSASIPATALELWGPVGFAEVPGKGILSFLTGPRGAAVVIQQSSETGTADALEILNRPLSEKRLPSDLGMYTSLLRRGYLHESFEGSPILDILESADIVPVWEVPGLEALSPHS